MELLLAAAYTAFFLFLVGKLKFFETGALTRRSLQGLFILKVAAGTAMFLVYTYYYTDRLTADTFKYFDDSAVIFDLFRQDRELFWKFMLGTDDPSALYYHYSNVMNTWWNKYAIYNDARTMIRLNVILRFFTFGHYHVHSVIFAFISFTGLVAIGKVLAGKLQSFRKEYLLLVLLFPSIAFWSAGIMKDGLIYFTLGFSIYFLNSLITGNGRKVAEACWLTVFVILLFYTKLHIFFLFLACGIGWIWASGKTKYKWTRFMASIAFCLAVAVLALHSKLDIDLWGFAAEKQHENIRAAGAANAGSFIEIRRLDGSLTSVVKAAVPGFLNAMFRPSVFDQQSPVILVSTIENSILLILIVLSLCGFRRPVDQRPALFYFSLFYVILLFVLLGIMTPVMGAIVRYKIQGLPFLFFVLLSLADRETLTRRMPFLRFLKR